MNRTFSCFFAAACAAVPVLAGAGGCHLPVATAAAAYNAATRKEAVRWDVQVSEVETGCVVDFKHLDRSIVAELEGISCPAEGEPFSREAKEFTSKKVTGETVVVELFDEPPKDPAAPDRQKVKLFLPDGKNLAYELTAGGLVWWIPKNPADDPALEQIAKDAKLARKGVWSSPNAIPPWYRHK